MKRILVPCDFSKQADEALKVAAAIAKKDKAEITILYVLPVPGMYTTGIGGETLSFDPTYFTRMEKDAKGQLEKKKTSIVSNGINVNAEVAYGDLALVVKQIIADKKIDLVIMGTSGTSGFTEIFIGSNTEKVVRFSPVPVLVVRKNMDVSSVKNILLPSTLDLNQHDFINKVKALQDFFGATLHILLVNTPLHFRRDAEAHEALTEFAKYYKLKNYQLHFRNYTHEENGIIEFAREQKIDLVAMGTHARKGLAHLFNGSVTEDVVNHIQMPIWTSSLSSK